VATPAFAQGGDFHLAGLNANSPWGSAEILLLTPGIFAEFPAGGTAYHLVIYVRWQLAFCRSVTEIGRDEAAYLDRYLQAARGTDGKWNFVHQDSHND
jgi:hypothetical protein